jgi:hypothetical protein
MDQLLSMTQLLNNRHGWVSVHDTYNSDRITLCTSVYCTALASVHYDELPGDKECRKSAALVRATSYLSDRTGNHPSSDR